MLKDQVHGGVLKADLSEMETLSSYYAAGIEGRVDFLCGEQRVLAVFELKRVEIYDSDALEAGCVKGLHIDGVDLQTAVYGGLYAVQRFLERKLLHSRQLQQQTDCGCNHRGSNQNAQSYVYEFSDGQPCCYNLQM